MLPGPAAFSAPFCFARLRPATRTGRRRRSARGLGRRRPAVPSYAASTWRRR